jgi:hypothetical protein
MGESKMDALRVNAPVGVLDPFWQPKGYITAAEYSRFCGPVVPFARMKKLVFTSDEIDDVQNLDLKCSIEKLGMQMRTLVFFILFYLYLWLEVELRLIYHGSGMVPNFPVFFRGWAFFRQFTSYPGGLVEYLSAFLSPRLG